MPTYQVTVLFNNNHEAISEHSTPADAGTKLVQIARDLTDEDGKPTFQRIIIKPK